MLKWNTTYREAKTILAIAGRAFDRIEAQGNPGRLRFQDVSMDITACHMNGNPLDLDGLLASEPFEFSHDVFGIIRNIDRTTGKLQNCFSPRYSMPELGENNAS